MKNLIFMCFYNKQSRPQGRLRPNAAGGTAETKYGPSAVTGVRPNAVRPRFLGWDETRPVSGYGGETKCGPSAVPGLMTLYQVTNESVFELPILVLEVYWGSIVYFFFTTVSGSGVRPNAARQKFRGWDQMRTVRGSGGETKRGPFAVPGVRPNAGPLRSQCWQWGFWIYPS